VSRTWTTLASAQQPRMYHSTALLLRTRPSSSPEAADRMGGRSPTRRISKNAEIFFPRTCSAGRVRPSPRHGWSFVRKRLHGRDAERRRDRLGGAPRSGGRHPRVQSEPTLVPLAFTAGAGRAVGGGSRPRKPRPPRSLHALPRNTSGVPRRRVDADRGHGRGGSPRFPTARFGTHPAALAHLRGLDRPHVGRRVVRRARIPRRVRDPRRASDLSGCRGCVQHRHGRLVRVGWCAL
jgi:hypothetical protein